MLSHTTVISPFILLQNSTDSQWSWIGDSSYRMHRFRSSASAIKGLTAEILVSTTSNIELHLTHLLRTLTLRGPRTARRLTDIGRRDRVWPPAVVCALRPRTTHDVQRHSACAGTHCFHRTARVGAASCGRCRSWTRIAPKLHGVLRSSLHSHGPFV